VSYVAPLIGFFCAAVLATLLIVSLWPRESGGGHKCELDSCRLAQNS
jgi:hypothetical protein